MRCICCLSDRTTNRPFGLDGKRGCLDCGVIFDMGAQKNEIQESDIYHFKNIDPHLKVGESKRYLFNSALDDLSLKIGKERKSILDVGCGFGYFLELASKRGWKVSGVEIVGSAVRDARARVGNQNIFQGTLREAEYPDNSFDVITLWDVLFHLQDPFQELRECLRVLRERGFIGIRVRNVVFEVMAYRIYSTIKKMAPGLRVKTPYAFHRYCFSSNSLSRLLHRVGFTKIQITNSPLTKGDPYGYTHIKMLVQVTKGLLDFISGVAFLISGGKRIIGPSLLVWAQKPISRMSLPRHND